MKIDIKTIVLLVVIAILIFFLIDTCVQKNVSEGEAEEYVNYKDTVFSYKAKNGQLVHYNKSLEITRDRMLSLNDSLKNSLKDLKLKKPTSYTKIVTKYIIDTVELKFTDTLPCEDFLKSFSIDSSHYSLSGILTKERLLINKIEMPNTQRIVVGTKKNGIFKRNEYVITVQNSNPYIDIIGIQNYNLKPKKKWFEKSWFQISVGFIAGGITYRQLSR